MTRKRSNPVPPTTCQRHLHAAPTDREARFRDIAANLNCIIVQLDLRGRITFFNDHAQRFFDYKLGEILGKDLIGTLIPETRNAENVMARLLREIWTKPERFSSVESPSRRRGGETVWVLWSNKVLRDPNGRPRGVLCVGNDITYRRIEEQMLKDCCASLEERVNQRTAELTEAYSELQREVKEREWAERNLRSSEEKYRLVVENASEGIVIIQDHHIKYCNPRTPKVMNQSIDRLLSESVDEFIHPDDRDVARARRLGMMKGEGTPRVYALRIVGRDGATRWIELHSVLITWMGRPAILAFFNNITERKRAEDEVRVYQGQLRSLASELSLAEERERRRLATAIHDHVGQTLAIANIKLGEFRQFAVVSRALNGPFADKLSYIQKLMEQAIQHTRSLTFQLSPPILYELGFASTLEWFGEQIQQEHGLRVLFRDDGQDKPLALDVSVLLFQAVRELFMNVVKYARAREVRLSVWREGRQVKVAVADDGVGFDPLAIGTTTFGFFSIRERLKQFNGRLEINAEPGRGARVVLAAPLEDAVPVVAGDRRANTNPVGR